MSKRLLDTRGQDTERNRALDIARGAAWPDRYPARTVRNAFLDTWRDREGELRDDAAAQQAYREAVARRDLDVIAVWASQALDLITTIEPAQDLVAAFATEAELALARADRSGRAGHQVPW